MSSEIYNIIRQHPRERLLVQPLEWTHRHLELLQCSFEEDVVDPMCQQEDEKHDESGYDYISAAERLATNQSILGIVQLLSRPNGPLDVTR